MLWERRELVHLTLLARRTQTHRGTLATQAAPQKALWWPFCAPDPLLRESWRGCHHEEPTRGRSELKKDGSVKVPGWPLARTDVRLDGNRADLGVLKGLAADGQTVHLPVEAPGRRGRTDREKFCQMSRAAQSAARFQRALCSGWLRPAAWPSMTLSVCSGALLVFRLDAVPFAGVRAHRFRRVERSLAALLLEDRS